MLSLKKTTYIISKLLQRHYSLIFCVLAAFFNSKVNSIEQRRKTRVFTGKNPGFGFGIFGAKPGFSGSGLPGLAALLVTMATGNCNRVPGKGGWIMAMTTCPQHWYNTRRCRDAVV